MTREEVEKLVSDPLYVARHAFLPLIAFSKKERRYRKRGGHKNPRASVKKRDLAYPSHLDGHIFSFYAHKLERLYEAELSRRGLGKVVIGYRKGASNIRLAREAFVEIQARGECVAIALDFRDFFGCIDRGTLESVRRHHKGLQSLRSMRRIEARRRKARAL